MSKLQTVLTVKDKPKAMAWLHSAMDTMKDGKQYVLSLVPVTKSKTKNANAYAWVLIDKLAEYYGVTKTYIYCRSVNDIGGNSYVMTIDNDAVERAIEIWESRGLGWFGNIIYEGDKYTDVEFVYGSSVYDTKQMARLVDNLIHECETAGIETRTQAEIESMLSSWVPEHKRGKDNA